MPISYLFMLLAGLVFLSSCSSSETPAPPPPLAPQVAAVVAPVCGTALPENSRPCRQWIDKVSRSLLQKPIASESDYQTLEKLSNEEIVSKLIEDPAFGLTVLDFNIYFLGFKSGKTDLSWAARFPSATSSAIEVLKGGDFFKLFDYEQNYYLFPVMNFADDLGTRLQTIVENTIQEIESKPSITLREACEKAFAASPISRLQTEGAINWEFAFSLSKSHKWNHDFLLVCTSETGTVKQIVDDLKVMKDMIVPLVNDLKPFRAQNYAVKSLSDLKPFDAKKHDAFDLSTALPDYHFWLKVPNSSTNFNRKRAAYIFKRFFCDDLTPIKVEQGKEHFDEGHASNPDCMACHYKLDPMAGFFKLIGWRGVTYEGKEKIYLDDFVNVKLADYESVWKKGGRWDIGYIRSSTDASLNTYGETLSDLFHIIRSSPEAKSCLVKRLHSYFVDDTQKWDSGYLKAESDKFEKQVTAVGSTKALKEAIKDLLLTKTFAYPDRDPKVCYDYAPGTKTENRPPCEVASILESSCFNCHNSSRPAGGLALDKWEQLEGGFGFPHMKGGKQLARSETFTRIVERLSSTDSSKRMPLNGYMPNADRTSLYLWAQSQVENAH